MDTHRHTYTERHRHTYTTLLSANSSVGSLLDWNCQSATCLYSDIYRRRSSPQSGSQCPSQDWQPNRRTDGQTDGRTDGRTEEIATVKSTLVCNMSLSHQRLWLVISEGQTDGQTADIGHTHTHAHISFLRSQVDDGERMTTGHSLVRVNDVSCFIQCFHNVVDWSWKPLLVINKRSLLKQEIRSVEHGICPIAELTSPWLHCAYSNRIPYPLFCWCRDVHLLLKNIKWILKSH